MPDVTWTHPALPFILEKIPRGTKTLVDVGCGRGIVGALCRIYREPDRLVGMDIYSPYLEFAKQYKFYDEYIMWNLENLPLEFEDREFDVATCIEVIEHLPRNSGEELLDELERIAGCVIVTTPNSFFKQTEFDHNPHQKHISRWSVRDFRKRNYKVFGIGGMKIWSQTVRYISPTFGPLTKYAPTLSTLLLCVK